jgi:hypothetical protein
MSNEIQKYKAGEVLPALANDPMAVIDAIQENMAGATISEANLTKLKVPSGGALFFEVPALEGPIPVKDLVGTIVYHRAGRAYFDTPFDQASDEERMPKCQSDDGLVGFGTPGGKCIECALSKYGSAPGKNGQQGRGQACGQRQVLYMMRGEQMIPDLVVVPPTSLKVMADFLFKLATSGVKYYNALISLSLVKEKNQDGIEFGRLEPRYVRALTAPEAAHAAQWNNLMKAVARDASESRRRMIAGGQQ